ncbi:MAG: metal-dependent transcriptional regulator [Ktedonobacterales bacterium]|nr:metal-dependent transcriptional regulator [Ktedonobacterales bacterium]
MPKSLLRQQLNLSEAVEDYLKAIYHLREALLRAGEAQPRVTTMALAGALGVAPGSVTGMIKKLADEGLVSHKPYYGVELTPTGERLALELVRHHRLLELYLTRVIGFGWDEVHDQADALEHAISEEFEERIDLLLGCPTVDPHGDPIPTKEGELVMPTALPLSAFVPDAARELTIVRVLTQDAELLRYLGRLGLVPGVHVTLLGREPFGGPLRLRLSDAAECVVGPLVAAALAIATSESILAEAMSS